MKYRIEKTKVVINYTGGNVNLVGNASLLYLLFLNHIRDALKFVSTNTNHYQYKIMEQHPEKYSLNLMQEKKLHFILL